MIKKWTWNSIYRFCVDNNLYTVGDNEHYSAMLDFVNNNSPTEYNIRKVAIDLVIHSEGMSFWDENDIANMVANLTAYITKEE